MRKWKIGLLVGVISLSFITGCGKDKKEIEDKAKEAAIEYILEEENKKFIVNDVEWSTEVGGSTVFVYGYTEEDSETSMVVTVVTAKDYLIEGVGIKKNK